MFLRGRSPLSSRLPPHSCAASGIEREAIHVPFRFASGIQYHVADSPARARRASTHGPPLPIGATNGAETSSVSVSRDRRAAASIRFHAQEALPPSGRAVSFV